MKHAMIYKFWFLTLLFVTVTVFNPNIGKASDNNLLVLEISYDGDFSPFTYQNRDGIASGILMHTLKEALESKKIKFNLTAHPWKRTIVLTDKAMVDASIPWRYTEERTKKYHLVGPITPKGSPTVIWGRKSDTKIKSWESICDLSPYSIGAISGYRYPVIIEDAKCIENMQYSTVTNKMLLQKLRNKRVDLIIGDRNVLEEAARQQNIEGMFEEVIPPLEYVQRYLAVPKSKPQVAKILQDALDDFHDRSKE
ncbi:transporter substrate-binding domain-containing protein [Rhodospirillaceae bacterium RKSG073]|nr:transporter substrate-binding domain-containing protein [Curvivirga aplysinae]